MSVRILTGDCRDMLATLPDKSVQCCVTSPPYFGLRAYLPDGHADKAREIGTEQTPAAYVAEMVAVFREVRRVLRDDGTVWLNLGDSYAGYHGNKNHTVPTSSTNGWTSGYDENQRASPIGIGGLKPKDLLGIPWMVAFALRADGWWIRSEVTWCKGNAMPESVVDRPTSATEKVFLFTKASRYFYDPVAIAEQSVSDHPSGNGFKRDARETYKDQNGARGNDEQWTGVGGTRNARNWWVINSQPYSGAHFATMPPDLAERCIKAGTSERGQCPHCAAPWARVVERETTGRGETACAFEDGVNTKASARSLAEKRQAYRALGLEGPPPPRTAGWQPTCACPEHNPVPQTALDPFGGAGTTGLVADRLGRNAVLIELNPTYADLARERLRGDCPMFAEVA